MARLRRLVLVLCQALVLLAFAGLLPPDVAAASTGDEVSCADDCAAGCADDGCAPFAHHCGCCGIPASAVPAIPRAMIGRGPALRVRLPGEPPARGAPATTPPHRPPIA